MDQENFVLNPIDIVEDVMHGKKWSFSRSDDYELLLKLHHNGVSIGFILLGLSRLEL